MYAAPVIIALVAIAVVAIVGVVVRVHVALHLVSGEERRRNVL